MLPTAYEVREELVRRPSFVLSSGYRRCDRRPVLLKYPGAMGYGDVLSEREYVLLCSLNLPGVPKPIDFIRRRGQNCTVFEDHFHRPLAIRRPGSLVLGPKEFLELAVSLTSIVVDLHRHGVTHRQIQPRQIFRHPENGEITLFCFAFATTGKTEDFGAPAIPPIADLLAYVSPELTGRMNRPIDYRTDFYSLGITFYELLTGRLPFNSNDPLEIVHWHIAGSATSPHNLDARIPVPLSELVMKLLSKDAGDRYQSARGLLADLEKCRQILISEGRIAAFPLAQNDATDRFLFPQKLYGRERELEKMFSLFARASAGEALFFLVSGYSGVGKSSLVQELYRPVIRRGGYFITGKVDQVIRSVPFGALFRAFEQLVDQLLAESQVSQQEWKRLILQAVGQNAGVIAEAIPRIEYLIGKQDSPSALGPEERQNRFHLIFQTLLGVFATEEHPLVMFLDDLERVDAATVQLLHALSTHPESRYLLIVGAYRDNEIDATHPLAERFPLGKHPEEMTPLERLSLGPLDLMALGELVADTLQQDPGEVASLARLVKDKTDGNPFFVTQFLKSLHQQQMIQFDPATDRWTFDLEKIATAAITDNVIELMAARIDQLSQPAQLAVKFAACYGAAFDLATLAGIQETSIDVAAASLHEAIEQGLVVQVTRAGFHDANQAEMPLFALLHDRVQQAAYELISPERRELCHVRIGRLLLRRAGAKIPEKELFSVVTHLNLGRRLMTEEGEIAVLSRLNFDAGCKAKLETAFGAACDYFRVAMEISSPSGWVENYRFTFALHLEAAECEYLVNNIDQAERAVADLLTRARTPSEKVQVYRMKVVRLEYLSRYHEAVQIGNEALSLFGLAFPDSAEEKDSALQKELTTIRELIGDQSIESLIDLPIMSSPEVRSIMQLLASLHTPCYLSANKALTLLNAALMVRLSLTHGNTKESALAYVLYGMMLGPIKEDYATAYEFGLLAMRINDRLPDPGFRAKVLMNFSWSISVWRKPFKDSFPYIWETVQLAKQTGFFSEAGYALFNAVYLTLLSRRELAAVKPAHDENVSFLQRVKMEAFADAPRVILQWSKALQGDTENPVSLTGDSFDEAAYCHAHHGQSLFEMMFLVPKLMLAYTFEDYRVANHALGELDRVLSDYTGTIWDAVTVFYRALAITAQLETSSDISKLTAETEAKVNSLNSRLQHWANNSPENFRAQSLIVSAELARIRGNGEEAVACFLAALNAATLQECPREQALVLELLGRFLNEQGHSACASLFLQAAIDRYYDWGAAAKARQLEEKHPKLVTNSNPVVAKQTGLAARRHASIISLDFATLEKAARAIAAELEFDSLLKTLIGISIENAGAQRGVFLQERDGELRIMAQGSIENVSVSDAELPDYAAGLPRSIIQYVRTTAESLVLENALIDPRFVDDPYLRLSCARSIASIPVIHQGRFVGILYLENNLADSAFTAERVRVLHVICSQAAISLANARLYAEMKEEVERRRQAESKLQNALADVQDLTNRLEAENVYLQEEIRHEHDFEEMVGNSPALLEVLRRVETVAPLDSTVLILGETGTGKELIARAIHDRSKRKTRPLVKVNCGAISASLVESELFGHIKGSFTGALSNRDGRFKLADGGTLFLDEIGELPLETQVKILRVLQEQEFEPIGSTRTIRIDIRVIAATNRDLDAAVREMRFRPDLFYRLNVFPLKVPALRERKGDIPLLVMFFVSRFNKKCGKQVDQITPETMQRLENYDWPGNIREMQNIIERAVILSTGSVLSLDAGFQVTRRPATATPDETMRPVVISNLPSLDDVTKTHILSVLSQTHGVIDGPAGAAKILGLHPNTLRSRMRRLGIARTSSKPT